MLPILERADSKDIEHIERVSQWSSCCCKKTDSRLLKFVAQHVIILMIVTFSLTKLWSSQDCSTDSTYTGLLSLMIGVVLPQPK